MPPDRSSASSAAHWGPSGPDEGAHRVRLPLDVVREHIERAKEDPAFQRDPLFISRQTWWLDLIARYFRPQFRGAENLPPEGPMLLVCNHSGGLYTPEAYCILSWWYRTRGTEDPLYLLAHDFLFALPGFRDVLRKGGGLPASPGNADKALRRGGTVLVFPGGDHEAFRPWWERGRVDFGGRRGFIRLALRAGVPIVPIVAHGSHDTTIVLARGDRLARLFRLGRIRSTICPIVLGLPWGLAPGFLPIIPLPARITLEVLPPLDWRSLTGSRDDPEVLDRCYKEITGVMQRTLTRLVSERPRPWID